MPYRIREVSGDSSCTAETLGPRKTSVLLVLMAWTALMGMAALPRNAEALQAPDILVIANGRAPRGITLAHHYMEKRGIPRENLLVVSAPGGDRISRREYDQFVARPIRSYLEKVDPRGSRIRCLVLMFGLPLAVDPPEPTAREKKDDPRLTGKLRELKFRLRNLKPGEEEKAAPLMEEIQKLEGETVAVKKADMGASLDSEIALVLEKDVPLAGWVPSPHFIGYQGKEMENMPRKALMVARLDGPSEAVVRRIIDESLQAELTGLKGKAYFDARWPDPGRKELSGYEFYDASLHGAARRVQAGGLMEVAVNAEERLLQPGEAPDAALYCGWYSLGQYIDAFTWVKGAVGYHIASQECETLTAPGSRVWCKMMLEKGAAATVGPVSEPYVQAFPVPEIFFGLLMEGKKSLAECYAMSSPFLSWKMVLVGDPLYRPFKFLAGEAGQ